MNDATIGLPHQYRQLVNRPLELRYSTSRRRPDRRP
jgi:hypothetical protein